MDTTVTPDTIATAIGRPYPTDMEREQWALWITDARMLIRFRLGDLSELDQEVLAYVVREAVMAHIRRPDDATRVDIAVDDGRVSRTYTSSPGRVAILDDWWEMLNPTDHGGSFDIEPVGTPVTVPRPLWWSGCGAFPQWYYQ